jgi:hypothetical protein
MHMLCRHNGIDENDENSVREMVRKAARRVQLLVGDTGPRDFDGIEFWAKENNADVNETQYAVLDWSFESEAVRPGVDEAGLHSNQTEVEPQEDALSLHSVSK